MNRVSNHIELEHFDFSTIKTLKSIDNIEKIYSIGYIIDRGDESIVHQGMHIELNMPCAIKIVKKSQLQQNKEMQLQLQAELIMLESTTHPQIISVFDLLHDSQ